MTGTRAEVLQSAPKGPSASSTVYFISEKAIAQPSRPPRFAVIRPFCCQFCCQPEHPPVTAVNVPGSSVLAPGLAGATGLEPVTRALRKRCSLSRLAPRRPLKPHFISENGLGHPAAARPLAPPADKLVGKWSANAKAPRGLSHAFSPSPVKWRVWPDPSTFMTILFAQDGVAYPVVAPTNAFYLEIGERDRQILLRVHCPRLP